MIPSLSFKFYDLLDSLVSEPFWLSYTVSDAPSPGTVRPLSFLCLVFLSVVKSEREVVFSPSGLCLSPNLDGVMYSPGLLDNIVWHLDAPCDVF